jgi:hypothetical protein
MLFVPEAAARLGVSENALRKRIQRDTIEWDRGEEAGEVDPKAFQLPPVDKFDLDVLESEILKQTRPETVAEVREMTREVLTVHYSDEELRELRDIHLERVEKSARQARGQCSMGSGRAQGSEVARPPPQVAGSPLVGSPLRRTGG